MHDRYMEASMQDINHRSDSIFQNITNINIVIFKNICYIKMISNIYIKKLFSKVKYSIRIE